MLAPKALVRELPSLLAEAVKVTGRVESRGKGLAGVRVSDGHSVVLTSADGSYTLVTHRGKEFVWLSVPDGYRIPITKTGTARFYERLPRNRDKETVSFSLEPAPPTDSHAFVVLADPQTEDDYEVSRLQSETVPDVKQTLLALDADDVFGVSCGDIMFDNLSLYPRYEEAVQKIKIPFFPSNWKP